MNKIIIAIFVLILIAGSYAFLKPSETKTVSDHLNTTYTIEGKEVELISGISEESPNVTTKYFGNEVRSDLNEDGLEDIVFLLTQNTGGSGTFYYAVAALQTESGWKGSHGILLGDRIAPQTTEMSQNPVHKGVVVVNYATHASSEAMTDSPSLGKSLYIKLDPASMQFGEVVQNFEGEADPNVMTLDMKTWNWVRTTYNDDTTITPNSENTFGITFKEDGTFSATTDCNAMSGSYEVTDSQITFGPIAMTRKYCEGSQEMDFVKTIEEAQSFFFTSKGELVFDLKLDSGSATFR